MNRFTTAAILSLAMFALPACSFLDGADGDKSSPGKGSPGKDGSSGGPGKAGGGKGGAPAPSVVVAQAKTTEFRDSIEAVGSAFANEQADLNSTVTERIERINFTDGQYVPRGAVIAELVRAEQGANLRQQQAKLREAELQLSRLKQLQEKGFATRARIDEQQALVDVARAETQQSSSQISDRVIRAPFPGWLSLRRISPGTVVNSGTPIVTIVDHSKIKLDFTVPETFLSSIKVGGDVTASVAAFPGEKFRGRITSVDPLIDPVTRSVTARAILPNPDLRLRPGMLMTVHVEGAPREALTVPELAVVGEGQNAFVWKVDGDNNATRVPVQIGTRRDGYIEIKSGIQPGDRIVTEGTVKLRGPGPITPVEQATRTAAASKTGPAA